MKNQLVIAVLLILTGCSLTTQVVYLDAPSPDRVVGELKPAVIEEIADARNFFTIPEGSDPRLDAKIAEELGAEGRAKAVSGFPRGHLVTLNSDGPVTETIRNEIAAALLSHGYTVVSPAEAPADAPRIRVIVNEFWSYMPISFGRALTWTQQLKAWITTDVTVKTATLERQLTIDGYGAHIVQTGYTPDNIKKALDLALADYRAKLDARLLRR